MACAPGRPAATVRRSRQFADGHEVSLTGHRSAHRTFARPYIVSGAPALSAYHGGDLYDWEDMPWHRHAFLGEGEVNPMIVVETDEVSTDVTFFNTHGHLEDDFWVGVRVYDELGRWSCTSRSSGTSREIGSWQRRSAELLTEVERPFAGHAAFTFSEAERNAYPGRLAGVDGVSGSAVVGADHGVERRVEHPSASASNAECRRRIPLVLPAACRPVPRRHGWV